MCEVNTTVKMVHIQNVSSTKYLHTKHLYTQRPGFIDDKSGIILVR
jgi:hypothetical protein